MSKALLPPGPASPIWGMKFLRAMQTDYLGFVAGLQRDYPDIAQIRPGADLITHVFHPDWVRQVLVDQAGGLIRWERLTAVFRRTMGDSLLVTEGAQWQGQRSMLHAGFSPKRVAGYADLMVSAIGQALDPLTQAGAQQRLACVNIDSLMTDLTMDVVLRVLFGSHQVTNSRPVSEAIQTLSHAGFQELFQLFSWPEWAPWPSVARVRAARTLLNRLITQHIAAQQAAGDNAGFDLLTMLRTARDPQQPELGLSQQALHDQTMVIFQAGHETTATAMIWWSGLIARHPEVAQRIHAEIDGVLKGRLPTPEDLAQLPWLQASLKEALRLYPPAAILMVRRALRDIQVGPYTVPKGQLIAITPYLIQRDARWFEAPNDFKPERFLPGAPEIPRGAWMPFGTGPRVCIGQHFAMLEMGLIAAMLLQRFSLHWPTDAVWPAKDLAVTLRPQTPITLTLRARAQAHLPEPSTFA